MGIGVFYHKGLGSGWWGAGQNTTGQLGIGSTDPAISPTSVSGSWLDVAGGDTHSLFVGHDGQVLAVGSNAFGQLGDGTNADSVTGVIMNASGIGLSVAPASGIVAASAGRDFSLCLDANGDVWGCGSADHSQFGLGYLDASSNNALLVMTLWGSGITKIAAGGYHSLALSNSGQVFSVGNNADGSCGIGTSSIPKLLGWTGSLSGFNDGDTVLHPLGQVVDIDAGDEHSVFLMPDGTVRACGLNTEGQVGLGFTNARRNSVSLVVGLSGVIAVSAGSNHTLALKGDGTVWAWGSNSVGQLGVGDTTDRSSPVQVSGIPVVSGICSTQRSSYFLTPEGWVYACGQNSFGELGNGVSGVAIASTPTLVFGGQQIDAFGHASVGRMVHAYSDGVGQPGLDLVIAGVGSGATPSASTLNATGTDTPAYEWYPGAQPAVVGVLVTGKTVAIEIWQNGSPVAVIDDACTEIGDTGKYSWSIGNLGKLVRPREQYHWRMTSNDNDVDEGNFIIEVFGGIAQMPSLRDPSSYLVTH